MGAFENAIREGETFDSLLELYRESLDRIAALESQLDRDAECIREVQDELNRVYELRDDLRAQLADRDAEIERLRADLVWAVKHGAFLDHEIEDKPAVFAWFVFGFGGEPEMEKCDGTSESICRAVRSAREERTDGVS